MLLVHALVASSGAMEEAAEPSRTRRYRMFLPCVDNISQYHLETRKQRNSPDGKEMPHRAPGRTLRYRVLQCSSLMSLQR